MKKIIFITPGDASYGFKLAGTEHLAAGEKDVGEVLRKAMQETEAGMVVVDERLLGSYPMEQLRDAEKKFDGIFLVLPSPARPAAETGDYASRLIRQAIGYHVRLKA